MNIGITGASGMLGTALISRLSRSHKIFATSRRKGLEGKNIIWNCFDLTESQLLKKWMDNSDLDLLIHCAAIVNVDMCEEHTKLATELHFETTRVISAYLDDNNVRMIYISTDSVFDGKKQGSYDELDLVDPANVYAKTKFMGEGPVQSIKTGLVIRTNIIGWTRGTSDSFAEWVLNGLINATPLNLFDDVTFSPLHVDALSSVIEQIIDRPVYGLYHCGSRDSITKYDFGKEMAETFQVSDANINRVSLDSMIFKARRPKNMALNTSKLSLALKSDLPNVSDSIALMKLQFDQNSELLRNRENNDRN
jgi:dTDP-4-dehydrorhamnose reductase